MRRNLITAVLYTVVTTVIFGLIYPFVVTGLAQVLFHDKANGQLLYNKNGELVGSRIIGQPFSAPQYFHSRPSAAGNGYDAANSGGSNFAPTNKKLIDRVAGDVAASQVDPGADVPIDLVTASGSGLDPDITPAAAEFQVARVARERHLSEDAVRKLVAQHTQRRQLGFLGEPRVNVLLLNMDLDSAASPK